MATSPPTLLERLLARAGLASFVLVIDGPSPEVTWSGLGHQELTGATKEVSLNEGPAGPLDHGGPGVFSTVTSPCPAEYAERPFVASDAVYHPVDPQRCLTFRLHAVALKP